MKEPHISISMPASEIIADTARGKSCAVSVVSRVYVVPSARPDVAQPLERFFVLRREILEKRRSVAVGVCVRVELFAERAVGLFEFVESSAGVKIASHDIPPVCAVHAALCLCDGHIIPRLLAIHNIGMLHRFKVGNL